VEPLHLKCASHNTAIMLYYKYFIARRNAIRSCNLRF